MKYIPIFLLTIFMIMSCAEPESNVPPVEIPPAVEVPPVEEEEKDPYETSPLSSVSVTPEIPVQDLQGTWRMNTGGNITDRLLICLDYDDEVKHSAAYAEKVGQLMTTMSLIENSVIYQLYISGYVNYVPLAYRWNSDGSLTVTYTDKNTGNKTVHSMYKYSDSFIDEDAFENPSLLYGLWVTADKGKGLRFLDDGVLWVYKGNGSEKCRWRDSDGNALVIVDSFGFSEKVPVAKIGENLLIYNGKKYYKVD